MLRKYIVFVCLFSILSVFSQIKGQVFLQEIEKKFDKKAYKKCINIYESFEKETPESPYLFQAKEFYAKSLLHTKQKDVGEKMLFELLTKEYSFHFVEIKQLENPQKNIDTGYIYFLKEKKEPKRKRNIGIYLTDFLIKKQQYDQAYIAFQFTLNYPFEGCGQEVEIMLEQMKENYFLFYEKTSFPDSIFVKILPYLLQSKEGDIYTLRAFSRLKEIHSEAEIQQNWASFFSSLVEKKIEEDLYFCGDFFGFKVCFSLRNEVKTQFIERLRNSYFYNLCNNI